MYENWIAVAGVPNNVADEMQTLGLLTPVVVQNNETGMATQETIYAVIDTGAYITTIDLALASRLGLPMRDGAPIDVVGTRNRKAKFSECSIRFHGGQVIKLGEVAVAENVPQVVLIGRDILALGVLFADFAHGSWGLRLDPTKITSFQANQA